MSTTLKLELSDELELQLVTQAQKLNLSPESFALQSLTQSLNQPPVPELQAADAFFVITDMIHCLREAQLDQRFQVEVFASPITVHLAQIMQASGQINCFELVGEEEQQRLAIDLNPNFTPSPLSLESSFSPDNPDLPPQLSQIVGNLKNEDPQIRIQAIQALGTLYRDLP